MRICVVSGGSRGLGATIVTRLLEQGDAVCTFSRKGSEFVEKLSKDPATKDRFFHQAVDATDAAGIAAFAKAVFLRFKRLDVLVNNAGIAEDSVLPTATDESIDRMLDINLKGAILLTRECVKYMILGTDGRIVTISSIVGLRGYTGLSVYSATKAGLMGFSASLARELGRRKITVNVIAPGYLETEMTHGLNDEQRRQIINRTPLGRLGTPADVVPLIEYLLSPHGAFITGQVFVVDGGLTC